MLASILTELDGFSRKGRESLVLTLGATNRPWDLDPAALSRFERRMLISLPEFEARYRILRIHLEGKGLGVRDAESLYSHLAARTARLSGREIARLCKEAATRMLKDENADLPGLVDRGAEGVRRRRGRALSRVVRRSMRQGPANADKAEAIVAALSGLSPAPALASPRGGFAKAVNGLKSLA